MTDWRGIPVADINWRALNPRIGRSAHPLRRLCTPPHDGRVRAGTICALPLREPGEA